MRNSISPQPLATARLRAERLEDRFSPGTILSASTPLDLFAATLPLAAFETAATAGLALLGGEDTAVHAPVDLGGTPAGPVALPGEVAAVNVVFSDLGTDLAVLLNGTVQKGGGGSSGKDVLGGGGGYEGPEGGAIRTGFDSASLQVCDDCVSTSAAAIGFTFSFYGVNMSSLFVYSNGFLSNNGNISPAIVGVTVPLAELTGAANTAVVAPFWADVDIRNGNGRIYWGQGFVDGFSAWAVTYDSVGRYDQDGSVRNTFQWVVIDYSEFGAQLMEFNYRSIQWESGDFQPDLAPRVGITNLQGIAYEATGSGYLGLLGDYEPTYGLANTTDTFFSGDSGVTGRHYAWALPA